MIGQSISNYPIIFLKLQKDFKLHMNRQDPSCQILLKIYTKRQNRQDVFIDGVLIPASNSVLEADGTLSFSNPDPSIHIPQVGDGVGVNFFDRTEQMLYVNVQGNSVVRVIVAKTLVVEFQSTNTELTADELYDSENLRFYLASILGIDISKIKVSYGLSEFSRKSFYGRYLEIPQETYKRELIHAQAFCFSLEMPQNSKSFNFGFFSI